MLASALFSGSERHKRFLRFVVEQPLKGQSDKLNEFVLGLEVFNKNDSFDPRVDSIVRVEARRLRQRLKKYYQDEGRLDLIIIQFKARSFVPEFADRAAKSTSLLSRWRRQLFRVAALAAAGTLVVAAVARLLWWKRPPAPHRTGPASILVLPFENLSPAAGQEYLGESIDDALITGLTRVPGLRVISRGSVLQLRQAGNDPLKIAASLDVHYLVEGSVQVRDGRVRISAKMTDVRAGSYIWAHSYERNAARLADVQHELSEAIAEQIRVSLRPGLHDYFERRRAANPEAYAAFLKGQYHWYQQGEGSAEQSLALFQKAISLDPDYAPAWAWLSQSH